MNRMISKMTLALVTAGCACLAQAGVRTVDVPRITNGGTGYIGLTESAGTPRPAMHEAWRGTATMGSSAADEQMNRQGAMVGSSPMHATMWRDSAPAMGSGIDPGASASAKAMWSTPK